MGDVVGLLDGACDWFGLAVGVVVGVGCAVLVGCGLSSILLFAFRS